MKFLSLFLSLLGAALFVQAQGSNPMLLYPDGVPNSKPTPINYIEKNEGGWITQVSIPTLTPYYPEKGKANGTAVIVCPGGGYMGVSMENEGTSIAKEFNKTGVTAFVLKYRLPYDGIMNDKTIGPLQDAQQAILTVRQHAAEWGINANRIGIIGFSAGGHLASTEGTHYSHVVIENKQHISVRPDFMMLIYPVISFGNMAHVGSREALIGKNAPAEQVELYSNEKQITADTPPTFLVHAEDDNVVPVQNSLMFYDELLNKKVKAEMHIFQAGGHGFGLNNPKSVDHWFNWCNSWMALNGLLSPSK
jgi:acetyl esterase/lipase